MESHGILKVSKSTNPVTVTCILMSAFCRCIGIIISGFHTLLSLLKLLDCFFFSALQADVILVDIDGGHLSIPDSINLPYLPEPFLSRTRHELTLVSLETQFSSCLQHY